MSKHRHRVLVCAPLMIAALVTWADTPALAQQPALNTIYTFPSATNGYWPRGGLAIDTAGALYGTTLYSSNCANAPNCGTIYKLTPPAAAQTAWSYQLLHTFSPNPDGIAPISPLTNYQNVMYGTASAGGDPSCGCGVVFSITTGGTYTILHTFDPHIPGPPNNSWPNGTTPIGGLLIDSGGTIYGTTSSGGTGAAGPDGTNGAGIIYRMSTSGAGFTVLHNFDGSLNGGPQGMMIFGQDGAIYGTQYGGGQYNQGVIWRMTTGGAYSVIYNFKGTNQPGNSSDGANPEGRLALGPDGTIYGTTTFGGSPSGYGTAWSIKQVGGNWTYSQLYIFGNNGAGSYPHSGAILASDGALYGTTSGGGQYGGGVFYKLVPQSNGTWSYVTLHNFVPRNVNGDTPYGDLLYANNSFYGMNLTGGAVPQCTNGCGTVFQFNLRTGTHNFNGDGFSDIAWRDNSGNLALWLMNGPAVISSGGLGMLPTTWSIVGLRDFNGDGFSDLLWRDNSGNTAIWFLNGAQVAQSASLGNIPTNWSVVGTGDFNADGFGDILWRDGNTGSLSSWLMSGSSVLSAGSYGAVPLTWTVAGTGDFNGDGRSDILWRDGSGNVSIWFMNGTQVLSSAGVGNVATNWTVAGTGDFNGDGKSDIVWRDTVGDTAVWLMNANALLASGSLGNVGGTWAIVQTGDFNGDGKSDLMWRDGTGNMSFWYMNGTAVAASVSLGALGTAWTAQAAHSE